jgi:hypothetical protein
MNKAREYECPFCEEFEEVTNYEFDGSLDVMEDKDGNLVEFISVKRKCYKCGNTWTEHLRLVYDGFTAKGREYDKNGNLVVDWVDEDNNPYEGILQ